jgi:hypothetical protein
MTIEDTARRWWHGRKALALGLAAAAVVLAAGVGYVLAGGSETFRTAPDLVARLDKLGAPCLDLRVLTKDQTMGICTAKGEVFSVGTDPADAERNLPEWPSVLAKSKDNDAVAVGDGWYVYGDRTYVTRVAELLGADLIS